jgi:hypothetical protein
MKWLKRVGIVLLLLILGLVIGGLILSEDKPEYQTGQKADALANKMLNAINYKAWDSTRFVTWSFLGIHAYVWDKQEHMVEVKWDDKRVVLNTKSIDGKTFQAGKEISDTKHHQKLIDAAWSYFCNDSFWLIAPSKAFDPGTERGIVDLEGEQALMVTYTSGGVTPGDAYLWRLDDSGLPVSWKMWVQIIPIGGIETGWSDWVTLSTGAKVASMHKGLMDLEITNIKGGVIIESDPTLASREQNAKETQQKYGATFLHPSNQIEVIRGQATCAFELISDEAHLDYIFSPVGGGGLIAGTCLAVAELNNNIIIHGAEPMNVDDAHRSLISGKIEKNDSANTIADGLKTNLGDINFPIIHKHVDQIIRVEEEEIIVAMKLIWTYMKIIVEPSSAVALAGVIKNKAAYLDKKVGLILSGGNVDLDKFDNQMTNFDQVI